MQLIVIVVLGAILGFTYGVNGDGFIFSPIVCLFAGITLIMPSLFNFELKHIKLVWVYKKIILKSIAINYLLLPFFALVIGFATGDFGIAAGLFMLAVLSGGGMVMHWIKKSKANTSLGFLLLFINLLLITFSLSMLNLFGIYGAEYFDEVYNTSISISQFSKGVLILLILIPFIASRLIRLSDTLVKRIQRYSKIISQVSIFLILFYLFGLQNTQVLIDVWDFEPELIPIAFFASLVFYSIVFYVSRFIYDENSPEERAAFWHTVTRYLTLALVIATFTLNSFGVSMLLPIMFAYLIQIPQAVYINYLQEKSKKV